MASVLAPISSTINFLYTLYLFTKSDIKTTVVPISVLAAAAALENLSHLPHVIFWVWLHILQFDIGNQIINPEEDKLNKKHRPLASGRITPHHAFILRWATVPACLLLSYCYSTNTIYSSIAIAFLTFIYNELGGHRNWISRGIILAVEYGFFGIGACLVSGPNPQELGSYAITSVLVSAGVYLTTQQALDFKDIEGDRLLGRKTIPIAAPSLARPSLVLLMCIWTTGLTIGWKLDAYVSAAFYFIGYLAACRFLFLGTVADDKRSCLFYHIWLSAIHVLPAYWRFSTSVI